MFNHGMMLVLSLCCAALVAAQVGPQAAEIPSCVVSTGATPGLQQLIGFCRKAVIQQPSLRSIAQMQTCTATASDKVAFCRT